MLGGKWSTTNNQAANNRVRRKTDGRVTMIRDLVNPFRTQYRGESVIADLSKTRKFNRFSEESKKGHPKIGKDRIVRVTRSLCEYTVPILRQTLTRRTVILHMRNMFKALEGTEAKDEESM